MAVNWWLLGLAFVLGFAITLALVVRRIEREVPVYETAFGAATRPPRAEDD